MCVPARLNPIVVVVGLPTTGAGTGDTFALYTPSYKGQILGARFTNSATVAADATHYTTLTVQIGATVAATISNAATAYTADTPRSFTMTTTTANARFAAGDVIKIVKAETGNGAAITTPCFVAIELMQSAYGEDLA